MLNLFDQQPKPRPEIVARIKEWTCELFPLSHEATVMVSELRCQEQDCPDVETVIAILAGAGQTHHYKLLKPMAEVTREDLSGLLDRATVANQ